MRNIVFCSFEEINPLLDYYYYEILINACSIKKKNITITPQQIFNQV